MALFPSGDQAPFTGQHLGRLIAEGHDVIPQPNHELFEAKLIDEDVRLPAEASAYFFRADAGPRCSLNAQQCQALCGAATSNGRFSIATIECSSVLKPNALPPFEFISAFSFLRILDGFVDLRMGDRLDRPHHAETALVAPGKVYKIGFSSPYAHILVFSGATGAASPGGGGGGIEGLFTTAGQAVDNTIPIGDSDRRTFSVNREALQAAAVRIGAHVY